MMTMDEETGSLIFKQVDEFIQRLHDLEYVINRRGGEVILANHRTLAQSLADAMSEYEEAKLKYDADLKRKDTFTPPSQYQLYIGFSKTEKETLAQECWKIVQKAYAWGAIDNGEALPRKLKECQERNVELQADNEKLSSALESLQKEYDEYRSRLRPTGSKPL
jgi:chromosome segregation ATPase